MIKISKYLYIHPITVILFVICFVTKQAETLSIAYLIMLVHELAHLLAAVCIGLKPSKIVIYPFGVNLKLKNKMIYSLTDEIILYAAGPLSNICMALSALCFLDKIPYSYDFYVQNIALFLFNMLPVVPLDGGVIAKKILSHHIGCRKADYVMRGISAVIIILIASAGVYFSFMGDFNYSICFLCIFLICNILTSKEKYNIDFLRELMYYKENRRLGKKVKIMAVDEDADYKKIVSDFVQKYFYVAFVIDKKGKVSEMLTETEIIEKISK